MLNACLYKESSPGETIPTICIGARSSDEGANLSISDPGTDALYAVLRIGAGREDWIVSPSPDL